jgi:threonyl-tRNA synthetase
MPSRFGLTYIGPDNAEHELYVVHRALYGSFERFIGILIEHYGGAFPLWLAPVQVRIIPVGQSHRDPAGQVRDRLAGVGLRVELDDRDDTVGKRIRDAEVEKIPYVVVYGDRESEDSLAIRERGGDQSTKSLDELVSELSRLSEEGRGGATL